MPKFRVNIATSIEVELDQRVIDAVTAEWRSSFYPLDTPEQIAEHIAYNVIVNNCKLSDLDGFANFRDGLASVEEPEWDIEAESIKS